MNNPEDPLHLSDDERIVYEIKRHWLAMVPPACGAFFMAALPLLIFGFVVGNVGTNATDPLIPLVFGIYALWLLIVWSYLFMVITDYSLDRWYITNKRLIDVEQEGLFNRQVSSLQLEKIQDVTVDVNGLLATFLSYGNLHVQSAGTSREFELITAQLPQESREMIMEAKMNN